LEGILEITWFQAPCHEQGHRPLELKAPSNLALNGFCAQLPDGSFKRILCTAAPGFLSIARRAVLFCNSFELLLGKGKALKGSFSGCFSDTHKEPHRQQGSSSLPAPYMFKMCLLNQQLERCFNINVFCNISPELLPG